MLNEDELQKSLERTLTALADEEDDEDKFDASHAELLATLANEEHLEQIFEKLESLEEAESEPLARSSGGRYENWLGELPVNLAAKFDQLPSFDALVQTLSSLDNPIRVSGARHSDNRVARPDPGSILVDLKNWRTAQPQDVPLVEQTINGKRYVQMFAWETLDDVAKRGAVQGFALENTGSFTGQSLAGPLSMGTHGSGSDLGAMCDQVAAVDIVDLGGTVHRLLRDDVVGHLENKVVQLPGGKGSYSATENAQADFRASVVNLGTLGVVLSYFVQVEEPYWLTQRVSKGEPMAALDEYFADLDAGNPNDWRHVELLVMPEPTQGTNYECVVIRRKLSPVGQDEKKRPKFPGSVRMLQGRPGRVRTMGSVLSRSKKLRQCLYAGALSNQLKWDGQTGPWSDVLVRNTNIAAHGFEVAVPAYQAKRALQCVLEGIKEAGEKRPKSKPTSPLGVRFAKSSEQYLAMTYKEVLVGDRLFPVDDWCFIEVPRLLGTRNQERIPSEIVERLRSRGVIVRLHWGQYAPPKTRNAQQEYPKLRAWLGSRIALGAGPRWLTKDLCSFLGLPEPVRFTPREQPLPAPPPVRTQLDAREFDEAQQENPLVLCVHGIGDHRDGTWREEWSTALTHALAEARLPAPRFAFVGLDDLFEEQEFDSSVLGSAALQFLSSWIRYGRSEQTGTRSLGKLGEWVEWFPAMVAKWGENEELRRKLRERVSRAISSTRPTLIAAHSLGSLVAYDTLTHQSTRGSAIGADGNLPANLLTFGSQIGHPAVRSIWGGRITMPNVKRWHHVYNPNDPVLTKPVRLLDPQYSQTTVTDIPGTWADQHSAVSYLGHGAIAGRAVAPLLRQGLRPATRLESFPAVLRAKRSSERKALLVGVNEHQDSSMNLAGCVNDTFLMRRTLQEHYGYKDSDIHVIVNGGATAKSIRDQLEWLLEDAEADQKRLFYFSGHGARLPALNALELVDHQDECLVPHDFNWYDPSTAIIDDQFFELYSQLSHETRFTVILDCCHSGGMARAGAANVRGLSPPDDIRHQFLSYTGGSWEERKHLAHPLESDGSRRLDALSSRGFLGSARTLRGRRDRCKQEQAARGHDGAFMPVLLYACQETELAFEQRVGESTYGAFTSSLCHHLKQPRVSASSYQDLIVQVGQRVQEQGYRQTPSLEGPNEIVLQKHAF